MRSQIHFALSGRWPLKRCPIQAEFIDYVKGETHFLALVVPKRNLTEDRTEKYLEGMEKEARENGESASAPQERGRTNEAHIKTEGSLGDGRLQGGPGFRQAMSRARKH